MFGLVMIVKDEAERIGPCLASLRPVLRNWTVLDTGSTDGTQDIVRAALEGIPGKLYEDEFVNFGSARSRAFALARGTADWLLASDADMFWEIDADWKPDMSCCAATGRGSRSGPSTNTPVW
jgi:glycosyltransferase involved in cell wall biosynthesis